MSQLPISLIINVSVLQDQASAGEFNTSNVAIFSAEEPAETFGDDGYKPYVAPEDVATDFGTESVTYLLAVAAFSQQPNLLSGDGQLIVILQGHASAQFAFSDVATSGSFRVEYLEEQSALIEFDDTADEIQTKLRAVAGLEGVIVTGSISSQDLDIELYGVYGAAPTLTIADNTLAASSPPGAVNITVTLPEAGESLGTAITRASSLVEFFGILPTWTADTMGETDTLAAANVVQSLIKMLFVVSVVEAELEEEGIIYSIMEAGLSRTRGLYYGDDFSLGLNALRFAASYAGRGLCVNFEGSNTTLTMNLKDLSGMVADPSMTLSIYNKAEIAGADIYASIQGVAKVRSFGANHYFDQIYNLLAFVADIQIAGFNYLAQTATKIPQTEAGMDGLKGAYREVCEQYVTNQFMAPGRWTSPTTFGNQQDLYANIAQRGYYIYSIPVSQQSQTAREDREAPLAQIAIKEAGAIHKGDVLVYVNA